MTVKQAVAFAILMENNEGISQKAPMYVLEKLNLCKTTPDAWLYQLLDSDNETKFKRYGESWLHEKS